MGRPRRDFRERFEEKVYADPNCGCWLWGGTVGSGGYGTIGLGGKGQGNALAHRIAYELHNGSIPDGLHVMHKCDNRWCVNPAHLSVGTPADNLRDMREKGRAVYVKGERHGSAKLTEAAVLDIRTKRLSQHSFARLYGVDQSTISDVQTGKIWTHVGQIAA